MSSTRDEPVLPEPPAPGDGFDVLDACHRQTIFALGKLAALVSALKSRGPDADARTLAAEIVRFFSTTAHDHHEDEELHVFPNLLAAGKPELVQAVQRLQQDHGWLEEDGSNSRPISTPWRPASLGTTWTS